MEVEWCGCFDLRRASVVQFPDLDKNKPAILDIKNPDGTGDSFVLLSSISFLTKISNCTNNW